MPLSELYLQSTEPHLTTAIYASPSHTLIAMSSPSTTIPCLQFLHSMIHLLWLNIVFLIVILVDLHFGQGLILILSLIIKYTHLTFYHIIIFLFLSCFRFSFFSQKVSYVQTTASCGRLAQVPHHWCKHGLNQRSYTAP